MDFFLRNRLVIEAVESSRMGGGNGGVEGFNSIMALL